MINPNKVKGVASKMESLVKYPEQRKVKIRRKDEIAKVNEETVSCKNYEDETCMEDEDAVDLKDFIDVITENNVVEDKELSTQLIFLMNSFIQMKKNQTQNLFPRIR
eukprot:GFUD01065206.1.p2 GENE.GFUD01065206.1~~GFUD01065206.1.p2  ORF type:complete len:107 (+),score=34.41 GFUD01065206.1:3-323(+)